MKGSRACKIFNRVYSVNQGVCNRGNQRERGKRRALQAAACSRFKESESFGFSRAIDRCGPNIKVVTSSGTGKCVVMKLKAQSTASALLDNTVRVSNEALRLLLPRSPAVLQLKQDARVARRQEGGERVAGCRRQKTCGGKHMLHNSLRCPCGCRQGRGEQRGVRTLALCRTSQHAWTKLKPSIRDTQYSKILSLCCSGMTVAGAPSCVHRTALQQSLK